MQFLLRRAPERAPIEVPHAAWGLLARTALEGIGKRFVYALRSATDPTRHYVGFTSDVANRLVWHNGPGGGHTGSGRPWAVVVAIEFRREADAFNFERYLKSGSGRAFAKRHFAA